MNIYIIFYNNTPPKMLRPWANPSCPVGGTFGESHSQYPTPLYGIGAQTHSHSGECAVFAVHRGKKKQDAKCSADTQEPKNQLHFMPKYSNPCLDYPELLLPSVASSPPAPNPTKQSQTKFLIFLILGWAEGDLSSLPVFQLGKLLSHATASINFPAPAAIGESFLGKIS